MYYQKQWQHFPYTNLHKIRPRQPRDLKLGEVIVYIEFQKIEIFKSEQHEMMS